MSSSYQVNLGSGDDPIQSYIERIKDDYEKELTLISELDHDVSQIGHDESKINAKTKQIDQYWIWTTNGGEYVTTYHWTNKYSQSQINQWQSQVNHLNSDVHNCTQKLEQLDIGLKGLDDTLEGLLRGLESTLSQDTIGNNIGEDVQKILGYVHELCNAMRQEAKANECEKICQETLDHGGNLNDVQKWAAAMREARFEEGSTLNALASTIADDLSFFHQQNDNATVDKNNFFSDELSRMDDDAAVANYKDMLTLLTNAMNQFSPLLSTFSSADFDQLTLMLDTLEKRIAQILSNPSLGSAVQQKEIMAIFMFVLSILGLVQQFAAKDKAQCEQTMSKASIDAAKMSIQDTTMQQTEFSNALHAQAVMGIIMKIFQVLLGAIMTIMAPGIGSAICMAVATVLDAAGVFDKLAEAIQPGQDGQAGIGGEIAVSAIELVLTMGGGALLDKALQFAMKSAMTAVTNALRTTIEEVTERAAKEAVAAAGQAGVRAAEQTAEQAIKPIVENAVKKAAEKMFIQMFKQNIGSLLTDAIKNGGFIKMAEKAMTKAAEEAAETAAQDASRLMQMYGKIENFTEDQMRVLDQLGEKAANEAVARFTNSTADKVAKDAVQNGIFKASIRRAFFTILYAIGTNNLLVDSIGAALKKQMSDQDYQKLLIALQVLQQFMAMIAQIVGTGAFSQVCLEGSSTMLMKITNFFQALGMGNDVITNTGEYIVDQKQAAVIQEIAKTQGALDIINYLESEIVKRQKQETGRDSQEEQQIFDSNSQLAEGIFKYYNASSQALAAAAV